MHDGWGFCLQRQTTHAIQWRSSPLELDALTDSIWGCGWHPSHVGGQQPLLAGHAKYRQTFVMILY